MAGDSPHALPDGFPLADLEVRGLVGAGRFGHVYCCADADGFVVAVREYLPHAIAARSPAGEVRPLSAAATPAFEAGLARFVERAEGMTGIRHPNVVRVIDVFRATGTAYASMDLATGESVAALLGDGGRLPADLLGRCFGPVVDGLAAMHAAGVVHGNIGPGSIVVDEVGVPMLLGLAAPPSDEFGAVAKPGYAPIEHYSARDQPGAAAADVYALGAVLYRCMTGVVPPEPPVRVERDTLVPATRAARGRYPPQLLQAVDAALAVQPDGRPATIDDLRAAISAVGGRNASTPPARAEPGGRWRKRAGQPRRVQRLLAVGAGAAIVAAVVGGLALRGTAPGTLAVDAAAERTVRDGAAAAPTATRIEDVAGDAESGSESAPRTYPFTVVTRPPGAAVRFANPDLAYVPGVPLRPGPYEVGAKLRGYTSWNGTVNHGAAPTIYAVALEFASEVYADPMASGGTGPEMAVVPAGSFRMGCGRGTGCAASELPVRTVTLQMPFAISKYEVTFEEFDRFADATGMARPDAAGWGRGRRPAINVSWDDATAYAAWLSAETGRDYALPSEAEWEYAARAGTETAFAWGDAVGDAANCSDCGAGGARTVPVGSFPANGWGLHDVHGNVWEWVRDCWNDSYDDAPVDGGPWLAGDCERRMLRGGSWFNGGGFARSASRLGGDAAVRGNIAGFRVTARDG